MTSCCHHFDDNGHEYMYDTYSEIYILIKSIFD